MSVSETIGQEAAFLGASFLLGAMLFFLYDVLRILRRLVRHGTIWISIEDFVYWLLCTVAVFVLIYRENDGMVRGFAFGGMIAGMLLYYLTLSRMVIRMNVLVLGQAQRFFQKVFVRLFGPMIKCEKKVARFFIKRLKKVVQAVKMGLCKR